MGNILNIIFHMEDVNSPIYFVIRVRPSQYFFGCCHCVEVDSESKTKKSLKIILAIGCGGHFEFWPLPAWYDKNNFFSIGGNPKIFFIIGQSIKTVFGNKGIQNSPRHNFCHKSLKKQFFSDFQRKM